MQANASKDAARIQASAIKEAQAFVYNNLDPQVIQGQATAADVQREQQRLALQSMIDPALSQLRYQSSNQLLAQGAQIGQGPQEMIAQQAATEAMASGGPINDLKTRLIDAAMQELELGATLPPDVQAELVQAGLEKSGMVSGAATSKGLGGNLIRKEVGQGAIKLQADRQARAAALAQTASGLETQRQQILQGLFPALQAKDLQNLQASQGLLGTSANLVPEAGLSGSQIANIWLNRVGAVGGLGVDAAKAQATGVLGSAAAWSPAIGAAAGAVGNALPSFQDIRGWFS